MNKHTPEPWESNGSTVYQGHHGAFDLRGGPNPEADARRIAVCVNCLAPFSTEQIESVGFDLFSADRPRLQEANEHIRRLIKQRDELLTALECAKLEVAYAAAGYLHAGWAAEIDKVIARAKAS